MPGYVAVKFNDEVKDPWIIIPELWVVLDDEDEDDDDCQQCWIPDNGWEYKLKNQVIWNGSSRGWSVRDILEMDETTFASIQAAQQRVDVLNHEDLETKRYDQLTEKLVDIKNRVDRVVNNSWSDHRRTTQKLDEIMKILKTLKVQANTDIMKPTLENLLPIKSSQELKTFESRFLNEDWISPALKELIGILTDDQKMKESIFKILEAIFSRDLAVQLLFQSTFDGQNGLKIKDLSIIKKIEVTLKNINAEYDEFQETVTSWFENTRDSVIVPGSSQELSSL